MQVQYNILLVLLVLRYSECEGDITLDPLGHNIEEYSKDETLDALDGHFDDDNEEETFDAIDEDETLDALDGHFDDDNVEETFDATEPQNNLSSGTIHTEEPETSSSSKPCLLIFTYFLVTLLIRPHSSQNYLLIA